MNLESKLKTVIQSLLLKISIVCFRNEIGEQESVRKALPESDKTCMYNPSVINPAASLSAIQLKILFL